MTSRKPLFAPSKTVIICRPHPDGPVVATAAPRVVHGTIGEVYACNRHVGIAQQLLYPIAPVGRAHDSNFIALAELLGAP